MASTLLLCNVVSACKCSLRNVAIICVIFVLVIPKCAIAQQEEEEELATTLAPQAAAMDLSATFDSVINNFDNRVQGMQQWLNASACRPGWSRRNLGMTVASAIQSMKKLQDSDPNELQRSLDRNFNVVLIFALLCVLLAIANFVMYFTLRSAKLPPLDLVSNSRSNDHNMLPYNSVPTNIN